MKILFCGMSIFCVALFLHIGIWKICVPRNQVKIISLIFLGTLMVSGIFLSTIAHFSIPEVLRTGIFFISLAFAYIATYPAIEADSPTLVMAVNIAGAGKMGLSKEKLQQLMNNDLLIRPRINDLLNAKMVYLDADKFRLTLKGIFLIRIFIFYRNLLNAGKGG